MCVYKPLYITQTVRTPNPNTSHRTNTDCRQPPLPRLPPSPPISDYRRLKCGLSFRIPSVSLPLTTVAVSIASVFKPVVLLNRQSATLLPSIDDV
ncbi:hypothetical protein vseg_001912 [Gypsophila vaccaria]